MPLDGKTQTAGFWASEICDNSLAGFPSGIDNSWGLFGLQIDGVDNDNFVEIELLNMTNDVLEIIKFSKRGNKQISINQFSNIGSTDDIRIRIVVTAWV